MMTALRNGIFPRYNLNWINFVAPKIIPDKQRIPITTLNKTIPIGPAKIFSYVFSSSDEIVTVKV